MIQHELIEDAGVVIVKPQGKLSKKDFTTLAKVIDPQIAQHGSLKGLMIVSQAFPGWKSLADMRSHLAFVRHHRRDIKKIALVTRPGLLTVMPTLVKPLIKAQIKHFDYEQQTEALAWLKAQ